MTVMSGEVPSTVSSRTGCALLAAGVSVGRTFFFRQTAEVFVPFTLALLLAPAS
jgi:hypothetical protein